MQAMVLDRIGDALRMEVRPDPEPKAGEVRLRVLACAVCRTDLHLVDGELPQARLPVVPGHEVVGIVDAVGPGVSQPVVGARVGVPWLGRSCGDCWYCRHGSENLCDRPGFTGCTRDGGFATHVTADARFCIALDGVPLDDLHVAPLLCAGLIGWRSLVAAGAQAHRIGLYGFGAAAHLMAQVARAQGREVFAFTRPGDVAAQRFALDHGASWAGSSEDPPPTLLDAAIIFAPVGELVPLALRAVRKGGHVVCGGIHMSDIPTFPYELLWGERTLASVANLTRRDATCFFEACRGIALDVQVVPYPLAAANEALADLRAGRLQGAAVIVPPATAAVGGPVGHGMTPAFV